MNLKRTQKAMRALSVPSSLGDHHIFETRTRDGESEDVHIVMWGGHKNKREITDAG